MYHNLSSYYCTFFPTLCYKECVANIFLYISFRDIIVELVVLHIHAKCEESIPIAYLFTWEVLSQGGWKDINILEAT